MTNKKLRQALETVVPGVPPVFSNTLRETLASIARGEAKESIPVKPRMNKRRTLVIVLAIVLMLAAVATAATLIARNVFDVTMGDTPSNAGSLTQYNLATETFGNAEVTIREAAYDGMSLYVLYSVRDMTATEPWGETDERGMKYLGQKDYERMEALGVGWWWDNLWIDGAAVDMPNMSGGEDLPGEEPGEVLHYMQYRLDQENLYLTGTNVEIAMPIGERQDFDSLRHNEETGALEKPEKGMVTFHLDCSSRENVIATEPNVLVEGPRWSAKATKVVFSPIQMYITLGWEIQPEVLAAYIEENGDGYYQDGVMLWPYDGLEVCGSEIMNLQLVDQKGDPVFEEMRGFYGCGGAGSTQAWYTFPYAEQYPEEMFLAPDIGDGADMTQAIRVK